MIRKYGFVYLWWDTKRNRYYLGSHLGEKDDGYVGSNKRFKSAYKSRPETFRRRILAEDIYTHKELLKIEQNWLSLIDDEELAGRYYNEKKVAAGGDIISTLSKEKRLAHKEKSVAARVRGKKKWVENNQEKVVEIAKNARDAWTEESYAKRKEKLSKAAIVITPEGREIYINCVKDFCNDNRLNYGNMKNVLRGIRKTVSGYRGYYV